MRIITLVLFLFFAFEINSLNGQNLDAVNEEVKEAIVDKYFTSSDGIKLHYLTAGTGPVLIIQPGWMMSADIFTPQLEKLSSS